MIITTKINIFFGGRFINLFRSIENSPRRILGLVFMLYIVSPVYGQNSIDSLLQSISTFNDTTQVKILTEKCWEFRSKDPDLAIEFGLSALEKLELKPQKKYYSEIYNYLGVIYGNLGKLDSAFSYYNKALEFAEEIGDSTQIAYSYNNIGDYYFKSALFSMALENIYEAYQIFEKTNDWRGMAYTLNDIGEIYLKQRDYIKAEDYFLRAGRIRLNRNDYRGYAKSLLNQAATFAKMGNDNDALKTYDLAHDYSLKANYIKGESWVLAGRSDIFFRRNQYKKALENRLNALEIDLEIGNKYGEIINYNQIGLIYLTQNNFVRAEYYLQKALRESKITGHRDQTMTSYNLLRDLSISSGNYKNAYQYLESYENLEDSIFSQESANKIADLQTAFLTERKERENILLKKDIAFEKQTRNYFILISLLVTGAVFLYVSKFKSEKKANKKLNDANLELNELNAQKDKMFSIIGHDLKNPVGSIRNFLELLNDDYDTMDEEEKKTFIMYSYESSKRLTDLLIELLEWGRLSRGLVDIKKSDIKLYEAVSAIKELLFPIASQKDITLEITDCDIIINTDKNMINTVLRNLVSNSIKFTPTGGKISINYSGDNKYHYISIKDNGIGIREDSIKDIFRIDKVTTTPGTENETGTGLGLPTASDFVKKCGGEIMVESKLGEGSNFIVKLPKVK